MPTITSEPAYHSYSSSQDSGDSSDSELPCVDNSDDSANSEPELFTSSSVNCDEPGSQSDSEPTEEVHVAIRSGDFGKVVKLKQERRLTDQEKYLLLTQFSIAPPDTYKFLTRIINGVCRHFQHSWLTKYNGLVYSESEDGGYCKFCVLFGRWEPTVKELGVLVNKPLTNFKKGSEKLGEALLWHIQGY